VVEGGVSPWAGPVKRQPVIVDAKQLTDWALDEERALAGEAWAWKPNVVRYSNDEYKRSRAGG